MNKVSGVFLSTFIMVCFLFSCGEGDKKQTSSNTCHIESTKLKYAMDYDSSWLITFQPDSSQPGALTQLQSSLEGPNDSYQEKIEIYYEGLPMRIADTMFHKAAITQIRIANPALLVTNEGEKHFGENHFQEYRFQFTKDSSEYIVHGYTFLKDSIGYTINYTASLADDKKFLPKVEKILSSFKPL